MTQRTGDPPTHVTAAAVELPDFTPIERLARQCTIYIAEVYDESGRRVVGMRARAHIGVVGGAGELKCEVVGDRFNLPENLSKLLRDLGREIARRAGAENLSACSRWWCRAAEGEPCRRIGGAPCEPHSGRQVMQPEGDPR